MRFPPYVLTLIEMPEIYTENAPFRKKGFKMSRELL
jgi:hypothetical protein